MNNPNGFSPMQVAKKAQCFVVVFTNLVFNDTKPSVLNG